MPWQEILVYRTRYWFDVRSLLFLKSFAAGFSVHLLILMGYIMNKSSYSISILMIVELLFSFKLFAADPILSPSETDLIHDRQERLLQDQQKRLDELQQLPNNPSTIKPELTDETRCFEVKNIDFTKPVT